MVMTSIAVTRLDERVAQPAAMQRGFTLIELLVVLSLISILAAMGMVQHRNSVLKAQEATLRTICSTCATPSISTSPTRASIRRRSTRW